MNKQKIHNKIRNFLHKDYKRVIIALQCLVIDSDFSNKITLIKIKSKSIDKEAIQGTSTIEELRVQENRLSRQILNLMNNLPNDLVLVKNRLLYEARTDLPNALNILSKITISSYQHHVSILTNNHKQNQLSFEQIQDQDFGKLTSINDDIANEYSDIVKKLSYESFLPDFADSFWKEALNNNMFEYRASSRNEMFQGTSHYSNDISKIDDEKVRAFLLRWEEEYIAGKVEDAEKYIDEVRTNLGIVGSMVNEYKALSYLEHKKSNKIINGAVSNKNSKEIKKLKFYLERAGKSIEEKSDTLEKSLEYIYSQLTHSLEKVYNNVAFDYSTDVTPSGASKKRNIIKRCIEIVLDIVPLVNIFKLEGNFIKTLVLELEGGGKYIWIKQEKHELIDSVAFNALAYRNKLIDFLSDKSKEELPNNLYSALQGKYNGENRFPKKLTQACKVADILYPKNKFSGFEKEEISLPNAISIREKRAFKLSQSQDNHSVKEANEGKTFMSIVAGVKEKEELESSQFIDKPLSQNTSTNEIVNTSQNILKSGLKFKRYDKWERNFLLLCLILLILSAISIFR